MSFIELVAQRRPPTPPPGMQPPENAKDWFRIDNSAAEDSDETDVYVYDSIGGWFGMYSDEFIDALKAVTTSKINLRLNSPGGSVFEGIAIANAIRNHPATVTVYVDSLAASIASVIMLAGDRVVMMPQSQVMIHNASGACYGDATEMTKMADLLDKQSLNIAQAYAEHTGRPLAEWQQYMTDETWFTAEEAVAVGLADEAMPMKPRKGEDAEDPAAVAAKMQRSWDLSMYQHAGRDNAPAPVINEASILTTAQAGNKTVDEASLEAARTTVTAKNEADSAPGPKVVVDVRLPEIAEHIREVIRAEIEAASKKLPAFLQPDEDEEEEEESESDDTDDASEADPEAMADESPVEDEVAVTHTEPHDENDEWLSLVARLTDTPSPSADDAFQSLKEGWL